MEERYIAAVDLGSHKIALAVAQVSGEDVQVLYYRERPSVGIRYSAVFNPEKASGPIMESIKDAENELNIKILQIVVGLPRFEVRQESARAIIDRTNPDECITAEEVENLKNIAQNDCPLADPAKEVLYGAIAQSYSSDEEFQLIESDIVGMVSEKFEGNFKLFIGKRSAVNNIDKVFNKLGIAPARKYFTPGTLAKAVLTDDEMANGVALIDLGGGVTSVSIYKGKVLRHYASIPFGGESVSRDIRTECSISDRLSENIKMAYGACMPERLQSLGEKTIQIECEGGYKQIPVKYLSEIITAREKEIILAVLYEIQMSGLAEGLRSGVVITGGGSNIGNIGNLIKELSGYSVKTGYPRHLFSAQGCPGVHETSAANVMGMLLAAKAESMLNCAEAPVVGDEEIEGVEILDPAKENVADGYSLSREESAPSEVEDTDRNLLGEEIKQDHKHHEAAPKQEKPKQEKPRTGVRWFFEKLYSDLGNMKSNIEDEEV